MFTLNQRSSYKTPSANRTANHTVTVSKRAVTSPPRPPNSRGLTHETSLKLIRHRREVETAIASQATLSVKVDKIYFDKVGKRVQRRLV